MVVRVDVLTITLAQVAHSLQVVAVVVAIVAVVLLQVQL